MLAGKGREQWCRSWGLRATSYNGKPGTCKMESATAKARRRGLMSKPVSIYFSLRSFLGSSLTSRGREKVMPVFKAASQTVQIYHAHMEWTFTLRCSPGRLCALYSWKGRLEKRRGEPAMLLTKSLHPIAASSSYSTQFFPHFWLKKFSYRRNSSQSAGLLGRAKAQIAAHCLARTLFTSWWAAQAAKLPLQQELEFIRSLGTLLPALSPPVDELLLWPPWPK